MNAIGYVRVSKREQAESGLGLEDQRSRIAEACAARGWDLLRIEADEGVSGGSTRGRDALARALEDLSAGRAEALVTAKVDRLSRSLADFVAVSQRAREEGWALVALDVDMDTSTPVGELVITLMAALAQFERALIGERTTRALAAARKRGTRLGRPTDTSPEAERQILAMRERGEGWGAIARSLEGLGIPTPRGGRRWYPATVRAIHERLTREKE